MAGALQHDAGCGTNAGDDLARFPERDGRAEGWDDDDDEWVEVSGVNTKTELTWVRHGKSEEDARIRAQMVLFTGLRFFSLCS